MPLSKAKDADRKREVRSVAFQAQATAKQIAQGVVQPTNEADRKRRKRQDAAQAQAVTGSVEKEDDTARNR